ncbi:unnamed protein product [Menidia menidia]|uniref:(Atlantic silverside) hypothetical protein n=1 Tax=Menidia menidia TaxID=238744 RepID=A0A8S4BLR7_9TELE|nr:unnamed protein product [Menidia menidia]
MGQSISIPTANPFQSSSFFSSSSSKRGPGFFTKLQIPVAKPKDFPALIGSCMSAASARTQEFLTFSDPEGKFCPSPQVLNQVFLATYIARSVGLDITDTFNCTTMTPEQRILLGADWVWALLEKPTKNPRVQIAVRVLHLPEMGAGPPESGSESIQMAQMESSSRSVCERMVEFCTSIGKDCYALFLFFGKRDDRENIYGVLSNNFGAAVGKCSQIDRALIENFLKGAKTFETPSGMMQAIVAKKKGDPLTLVVKFS